MKLINNHFITSQKANYKSLLEGQKHNNTLEDCFYLSNITKHQYQSIRVEL